MEAFNFTVANEDCCLYTYDMRKLSIASCLHKVCQLFPFMCAMQFVQHACKGMPHVSALHKPVRAVHTFKPPACLP